MTQININWLKHSCGFGSRTPGRQDRRRRRIHWAMAASKILSFFLALSLSIGHEMRNGVLKVDPKIGHLFLSPLLSVSFFAFWPFLSASSFFWAFLSFSFCFWAFLSFSFCFWAFFIFFFLLLGLLFLFLLSFGPFYLFLFCFWAFLSFSFCFWAFFFLTFFLRLFPVAVRPNLKPSGLRVEYSVTILDEFLQLWQNFKSLIIFRGFI